MYRSTRVIHVLLLIATSLATAGTARGQVVTLCDVFRAPLAFDRKKVAIYGEYSGGLRADVCGDVEATGWPLLISFDPPYTEEISLEDFIDKDSRSLDFFDKLRLLLRDTYPRDDERSRYPIGKPPYHIWGTFVGILHLTTEYPPPTKSNAPPDFAGSTLSAPMFLRLIAVKDVKITGLASPQFDVTKIPDDAPPSLK